MITCRRNGAIYTCDEFPFFEETPRFQVMLKSYSYYTSLHWLPVSFWLRSELIFFLVCLYEHFPATLPISEIVLDLKRSVKPRSLSSLLNCIRAFTLTTKIKTSWLPWPWCNYQVWCKSICPMPLLTTGGRCETPANCVRVHLKAKSHEHNSPLSTVEANRYPSYSFHWSHFGFILTTEQLQPWGLAQGSNSDRLMALGFKALTRSSAAGITLVS